MTADVQNVSAQPLTDNIPIRHLRGGLRGSVARRPPVTALGKSSERGGNWMLLRIQKRRNEASRVLVLLSQSNKRDDCWKRGRGPEQTRRDGEVEEA